MLVVHRFISALKTRTPPDVFHFSCALLFFVCQLSLVVWPEFARGVPVELDDSLVYIFKAVLIDECLTKNSCVALDDILNLESVTNYDQNDWNTFVLLRHTLHLYHFGHSYLTISLNALGLDWVEAFQAVRVLSSVVIITGIIFCLKSLFAPIVASSSLILLSFTIFPEQGIHIVTPGNTATGIFFWALGMLFYRGRHREVLLFSLCCALFLFHKIALLFVPTIYFLHFILNHRSWTSCTILFAIVSAIMTFVLFVCYQSVEWPPLSLPLQFAPLEWAGIAGIYKNLAASVKIVGETATQFGLVLCLFPAIAATRAFIKALKRGDNLAKVVLVLIAINTLAIIYVFPPKGGLLFGRIWVLTFVISIGFLCKGLLDEIHKIQYPLQHETAESDQILPRTGSLVGLKRQPFFFLFLCASLFVYTAHGIFLHFKQINGRILRHNLSIDSQPLRAAIGGLPKKTWLIYHLPEKKASLDTVPLLMTLINGGAKHRFDKISDFEPATITQKIKLYGQPYFISWSPLIRWLEYNPADLVLSDRPISFSFNNSDWPVKELYLFFSGVEDLDQDVQLVLSNGASATRKMPKLKNGWNNIELESDFKLDKLVIESKSKIAVLGLSLIPPLSPNPSWPYGEKIIISQTTDVAQKSKQFNFYHEPKFGIHSNCKYDVVYEYNYMIIQKPSECQNGSNKK